MAALEASVKSQAKEAREAGAEKPVSVAEARRRPPPRNLSRPGPSKVADEEEAAEAEAKPACKRKLA